MIMIVIMIMMNIFRYRFTIYKPVTDQNSSAYCLPVGI